MHWGPQVSAASMSMLYHMAVVDSLTPIHFLDLHVTCQEALEGMTIIYNAGTWSLDVIAEMVEFTAFEWSCIFLCIIDRDSYMLSLEI